MDRLSKSAHFVPINTMYRVEKYVEIYVARVLSLHGVPKTMISDRDSQFVVSLLRATARTPRDSLDPQFGLPPTDIWPNETSQPDP
jgi:hypothetical protein